MIAASLFLLLLGNELPPEQETAAQFAKVRRVYVDILTGGEPALKIRDMLIASLHASGVFVLTEDPDKADAVLRGAASDQVFTETFASSEGINARSQISLPGRGASSNQRYSDRSFASLGVGENESRRSEERKHEAMATVRLVDKGGDVIWSATEESMGAKFLGASADVVDKITKKLAADYRRAKTQANAPVTPAAR